MAWYNVAFSFPPEKPRELGEEQISSLGSLGDASSLMEYEEAQWEDRYAARLYGMDRMAGNCGGWVSIRPVSSKGGTLLRVAYEFGTPEEREEFMGLVRLMYVVEPRNVRYTQGGG